MRIAEFKRREYNYILHITVSISGGTTETKGNNGRSRIIKKQALFQYRLSTIINNKLLGHERMV